MGIGDKIEHKAEELKGKVKEHVGDATDDSSTETEGKADQFKGNIKQAGDDVKDAFQ
jgi:uncharacterized protein YjbJ (UPF0337 family)